MKMYLRNLAETFSQLANALHNSGDANQTFSARLALKRNETPIHWYWRGWIYFFETLFPGHLDWALGED